MVLIWGKEVRQNKLRLQTVIFCFRNRKIGRSEKSKICSICVIGTYKCIFYTQYFSVCLTYLKQFLIKNMHHFLSTKIHIHQIRCINCVVQSLYILISLVYLIYLYHNKYGKCTAIIVDFLLFLYIPKNICIIHFEITLFGI